VAGPLATRVLADHGAEVIKIERTDTVDDITRRGALFGNLNRGKRRVAVDLADARGRDIVHGLALRSDVMIDNFSPRVLANWGLDHPALCVRAPRLIALSLSAYGATGPLANRVGYGPTVQAELGFTWHMRHRGGTPAGCGIALADTVSGYAAALAIAAAVRQRETTGVGRSLDLAELEIAATIIRPLLQAAREGGELPDAFGNDALDDSIAPHGVYRCRDAADGRQRWCAIAVRGDQEWRRFVDAIGAPQWTAATCFATVGDRRTHGSALDEHIAAWCRDRHVEAVVDALQRAGIAAGLVADANDLAADPQLATRGYWIALPGIAMLDGVVPRLSETPGQVTAPGARLGADTDAVLRDVLAMEQSALARLRADGVVR
jgi:crotonobetainyl-CoA:carnitine CoA-transferase CaiB-like acyl-CoA transferase